MNENEENTIPILYQINGSNASIQLTNEKIILKLIISENGEEDISEFILSDLNSIRYLDESHKHQPEKDGFAFSIGANNGGTLIVRQSRFSIFQSMEEYHEFLSEVMNIIPAYQNIHGNWIFNYAESDKQIYEVGRYEHNQGWNELDEDEYWDDIHDRTSNDDRSDSLNPNNPSFEAASDNRSDQMNPNNSAYRSSRRG